MKSSKPGPGRTNPPEPRQSGAERMEQRQQRPGQAGLANEARPGLGTRADEERVPPPPKLAPDGKQKKSGSQHRAASGSGAAKKEKGSSTSDYQQKTGQNPAPHQDTRPPAREQSSDSMAQEEQRSTGMSGQSGGV